MTTTSADWLEVQADRVFSRQRAAADSTKLIATFSTAVVATLVGTALQVGSPSGSDRWASWLLACSAALAVLVILSDRLTEADHAALLEESNIQNWDDATLLSALRVATLTATRDNRTVLLQIRCILFVQIAMSATASSLAAISLLNQ